MIERVWTRSMRIDYIDRNDVGFSKEIERILLSRIEECGISINSLLFAKNGKIFYEKYFGIADSGRGVDIPNSEYALTRMFSICKSFTAIAIGLLIDEGKVSLSDRIIDYYNLLTGVGFDEENVTFDEGIRNTTIEDMLTMRTSHTRTTYKKNLSKNWVNSFFTVPSDKNPGESFDYDTSAAHVLCALVEKMTSMNMLDYIKMKMPELGLSSDSYIIKDPFGVSTGGTGLMCTTRDLFKFAILIANKGSVPIDLLALPEQKCKEKINYKKLISSEYITSSISKMVDTDPDAEYPFQRNGYGYYFWQGEHNGHLCYGMGGQFIYFLPEKDLILIATSDCSRADGGEQALLDLLWNYVANDT